MQSDAHSFMEGEVDRDIITTQFIICRAYTNSQIRYLSLQPVLLDAPPLPPRSLDRPRSQPSIPQMVNFLLFILRGTRGHDGPAERS